jgi:hypothetical protein
LQDLRVLIEYVDVNGEGELLFEDLVELIKQMRPRMATKHVAAFKVCFIKFWGFLTNVPNELGILFSNDQK